MVNVELGEQEVASSSSPHAEHYVRLEAAATTPRSSTSSPGRGGGAKVNDCGARALCQRNHCT